MEKKSTLKCMLAAVFAAMTVSGANAGWGDLKGSGLLIDHEKMYDIEMAPASDGSTFIAWINWSEDGGIDKGFSLYAQLLDPQGNKMWGETGILVDGHPSPTWCSYWNILVTPEDELVISRQTPARRRARMSASIIRPWIRCSTRLTRAATWCGATKALHSTTRNTGIRPCSSRSARTSMPAAPARQNQIRRN